MSIRLPENDQFKSPGVIAKQLQEDKRCSHPDCNEPLTLFKGPGQNKLCRKHQIQQVEYGGVGKANRLWTFSREWTCDWCGYSPLTDPWFENPPVPFKNAAHKLRAQRSTMVADHILRRVDGGTDCKENIQTLCQLCNVKKTSLYQDYKKGRFTCT
jgi:5-methylcytosine-specific restriction endonuclease McrA